MKKTRKSRGDLKSRQLIINEAARLMYQEGVSQYHTAKTMAARKVLSGGGRKMCIKSVSSLPSNGEISEAVNSLAEFHEGELRGSQLFSMRILALELMQQLEHVSPRLIGSVSTGRVRKTSDIDIHVFTDDIESLLSHIKSMAWHYVTDAVTVSQNGVLREYTHIYIDEQYPVELSVYSRNDIRVRTRSSTDGKPIVRLGSNALLDLILTEHNEQWALYTESAVQEYGVFNE